MVALPDHAHALHLATSTCCLMILDELLIRALLISITIEGLTVSADPSRSLSRSLNRRLDLPCVVQVKVHALFLMSRKFRTFKFS